MASVRRELIDVSLFCRSYSVSQTEPARAMPDCRLTKKSAVRAPDWVAITGTILSLKLSTASGTCGGARWAVGGGGWGPVRGGVDVRRVAMDGRDASVHAGHRWLETLQQGDFALIVFDDAGADLAEHFQRLGPDLATGLFHGPFGLPVGNAQRVAALPIADERHAGESPLLLEQGQYVLGPDCDGLVDPVRITLETNDAGVRGRR